VLATFVRELRSTECFDDAAAGALARMLSVCETAAAESEGARGRILRGMVHLRPQGGYRGLVVFEPGSANRPPTELVDERFLPSATAFRWLEMHRAPLAIDARTGVLEVLRGRSKPEVSGPGGDKEAQFAGKESRVRLLGRDATHLLALPFGSRVGEIDGMISIEAACRAAPDHLFVWPRCLELLTLLADVAAPYLTSLPLRPAAPVETDELLPVVGRATAGIVRLLGVFAKQDETILISGPTGSGKSRLARVCHDRSSRRSAPFEAVDLLSVPESMQMGELFGWKRGAFTGASGDHRGAVTRADKGTLFLDEIDKLSLQAQAGLLQLLEERRYRPLGDDGERWADVRFVVGTNADLPALVKKGTFREDLYYRINVLPLRLPSLGERADEIPLWASYMLARRAKTAKMPSVHLSAAAGLLLASRPWPGNLRQLDNVVRRAFAIVLAENGDGLQAVSVQERHVEDALAFEGMERNGVLYDVLRRAAAAFVTEVETGGGGVDLDHTDAFRGLVLDAAVRRLGSREVAFERLGKPQMLKNRNHHKAIRRELAKVLELARVLGAEVDPETRALAQGGEDGG
jgi:DNA-binding NtrC family response regulator